MTDNLIVLGIESSCDETSAAILKGSKVLSNIIASQKIHEEYGGVVPELASRAHQQNIIPVVDVAIKSANIDKKDIDLIAYTKGPGLLGSLLVGTSFAKSLSFSLNIPLVSVNHMQAHILAHFIEHDEQEKPKFPFLCLTVSGGHTQIVRVENYNEMKIIGSTLDDAAGEAFDKSGKILGLDYPAGPKIDSISKKGNPKKFIFTKPTVDNLNFSFSGLKTNFKNFINNNPKEFVSKNINDICASLQYTIVQILIDKIITASKIHKISEFVICGGVSANSYLRNELSKLKKSNSINTYVPKLSYSTDNAAMIGINAYYKYKKSIFGELSDPSISRYPL